jgi:hypothetical protein
MEGKMDLNFRCGGCKYFKKNEESLGWCSREKTSDVYSIENYCDEWEPKEDE